MSPSAVAFIPARHGSKRVPGKNIRALAGHPMLAYTIAPALESGVFSSVIVSTDSEEIAAIARHYGAEVPFLRPPAFAGDTSPDIEWLEHALTELRGRGRTLGRLQPAAAHQPVSHAPRTIRRAWSASRPQTGADSLRAVEKCAQHPGKMWVVRGDRMVPLLPLELPRGDARRTWRPSAAQPWHSTPYQALPPVYVQNASLEIAWTRVVLRDAAPLPATCSCRSSPRATRASTSTIPTDWMVAERLLADGAAQLPAVAAAVFQAVSRQA